MLRHQCRRGCCGVQVAVGGGAGREDTSSAVRAYRSGPVEERADAGEHAGDDCEPRGRVCAGVYGGLDGVVVCDDVVVDVRVVVGAGALPPLPRARMVRP